MESSSVGDTGEASGLVKLDGPDVAENGAVVPITVDAKGVDGIVESISIISASNGKPLVAKFTLGEDAVPYVSTRIKMGKTGDVYGVAHTASGILSDKKQVKVTAGGC